MKKRIIISSIISILVISSLVGCNNKKNENIEHTTEVISVEIDKNTPNITEMTKEEILSLSAEQVKLSVETYLPSYKTIYKINENRVMSNDDWLLLRDIICIQFYGDTKLGEPGTTIETDDPDAIYYAPNVEDLEIMGPKEFAIYLNNAYKYLYGNIETDFTTLDEESILQLQAEFIKNLKENDTLNKN